MVILFVISIEARAGLSDKLPLALVKQLAAEKIWTAEKDSIELAKSQEILQLLTLMKNEKSIEKIVNSMIDTNFSGGNFDTYLVKVTIFRYFLENPSEANAFGLAAGKLEKIERAWTNRYVHSAAALLSQANLADYQPTIDIFLDEVKSGEVQIFDLSPTRREKFNLEIGSSLGSSLTDKLKGKYTIYGFYHEKKQLFVLDFSRPLGETIITFAHEIIHAADPNLISYRRDFDNYLGPVREIIKKLVKSARSEDLTSALISQVFFELGREELLEKIQEQSQRLVQNLQKNLISAGAQLSDSDQTILHKWIRAMIGLSIENEYRAYGFSIVVYSRFKNQLNIIQGSEDRELFVRTIMSGDQNFAGRVSANINPFQRAYSSYQKLVRDFALNESEKLALDQTIHFIEGIYLDELKTFMTSLNNKFATLLRAQSGYATSAAGGRFLPAWTKPENFDSPANPYSLITARVSTMWAIRVKENILGLVSELSEMRKSLLVLRAGILDFHDLNFNDFEFLGIIAQGDLSSEYAQKCSGGRSVHAGIDYSRYNKYFGLQNWNSNMVLSDHALPAAQLLQQLLKVKLIQSLAWLEQGFPDVKNNIVGARVFIQKLREELYDSEDLSRERAFALQNELAEAIEKSSFTGVEAQKIQYLLKFLSSAHHISFEQQWAAAAQEFEKRQYQILKMLNLLGVEVAFDPQEFENTWKKSSQVFEDQVEDYQDECEDVVATYAGTTKKPFTIGDESFMVNFICSGKEVYFLRLPCDNTQGLSIMTRNNRPMIRPLYNSRFVELIPFSRLRVK
jgi:hypothetical protein